MAGKLGEFLVEDFFSGLRHHSMKKYHESEWECVYRDVPGLISPSLTASSLLVNKTPMKCKPDAVLKHNGTGDILIIERKVTSVRSINIPHNGWPNLHVQLWCYSWIDDWLDAPEIYLTGEIHRIEDEQIYPTGIYPKAYRSEPKFDSICQKYFELYGGEVDFSAR